MRNRMAVWAAGLAFAVLVGGLAVLAAKSGDDDLPKLPAISASAGAASEGRSMAAADSAMPAIGYASVEYRLADGVQKPADDWAAYRVDKPSEADVATLAKALGMSGTATSEDGAWALSDGKRYLRVDALNGQWWFGADPNTAVSSDTAISKCAPCPPDRMCAQVCQEPERPAGMPTKAEAEGTAREFWKRIGVDDAGAKVEVEDGFSQWYVHFRPTIGDTEVVSGEVSASVGPNDEILSANGQLGSYDKVGDYPLVALSEALDRLNNPPSFDDGREPAPMPTEDMGGSSGGGSTGSSGTGSSGTATGGGSSTGTATGGGSSTGTASDSGTASVTAEPVPAEARPEPDSSTKVDGDTPSEPGSGGSEQSPGSDGGPTPMPEPYFEPPIPTEPTVVTLTGVRVALLQTGAYLVPVYLFTIDGGGEVGPVSAVPDRYLEATNTGPQPQDTPVRGAPVPDGPTNEAPASDPPAAKPTP